MEDDGQEAGRDGVLELNEETFEDTIEDAERLVVVEFYTQQCPNCAAMEPVLKKLASDKEMDVLIAKVDAARHMSLAKRHGIMATPTFKFFCNGKPIGSLVGGLDIVNLRNQIKDHIKYKDECISKSTRMIFEIDGYG